MKFYAIKITYVYGTNKGNEYLYLKGGEVDSVSNLDLVPIDFLYRSKVSAKQQITRYKNNGLVYPYTVEFSIVETERRMK